ncbi:hypothetical protein ACWGH8_32760, partial [Nonomuraea muscovyensis]
MINFRNALATGAMVATAFVAPAAISAQPAGAAPVLSESTATTVDYPTKPCWKHKKPWKVNHCRNWSGGG